MPKSLGLTFTPENGNTPQIMTVSGVDDALDDGDQDVTILLGRAVSKDPAYAGIDPDDVHQRNMDDETPGIASSPPLPSSKTTEKGGKVTFTVQLRRPPT